MLFFTFMKDLLRPVMLLDSCLCILLDLTWITTTQLFNEQIFRKVMAYTLLALGEVALHDRLDPDTVFLIRCKHVQKIEIFDIF